MKLQTVKESVSKLTDRINVLDLFIEEKVEVKDLNLKHTSQIVLETANYLSGFMLGEKSSEAFQLPILGAMIYASDYAKDRELFNYYQNVEKDFSSINNGNILNLLEMVNNINCYYYSEKKALTNRLSLNMIGDIKLLAERIVLYSKQHNLIKNIYGFNGGYTRKTNRGHKVSVCQNGLFIVEQLGVDDNARCLELLSYYILCKRNKNFQDIGNIDYLVIFDPIKNKELLCKVSDLSDEIIKEITDKVL